MMDYNGQQLDTYLPQLKPISLVSEFRKVFIMAI